MPNNTGLGIAPPAARPAPATPAPPHDPSMPFRGTTKPPKAPAKKVVAKRTAGGATGPFPPPPPPPTDQQLIDQWVTAAQLPSLQAIQNAQAASEMAARNSQASTSGYYQALATLLKGIGPETQSTYQSAAGADSAFGKGFSNGLAMVQGQAGQQTDAAMNVAGAPAAQTAQATGALGGTGATDALYALGGYIPATTMNREGAAYTAAANMLPASAGEQGAQALQQIQQQQQTDQQGFAKQYSDLAAQVPGLSLQIGQQLTSQHAAAQAEADRVAAANATDVYRTDMLKLQYIAQTGMDPTTHKLTAKAQAQWDKTMNEITTANERVTISQQNADANTSRAITAQDKARGYGVDAQGNVHALPGYTANADGTVTKNAKPASTKWTPGQPVVSRAGQMRVNGYSDAQISAQLKKWHPKWTAAQVAATLKAAPKLYGDMTKTQVDSLRALASSLKTGRLFNPTNKASTVVIGGKTYKAGDTIPPIPRGQALSYLIGRGYSRADASAMLNRFYTRGKK